MFVCHLLARAAPRRAHVHACLLCFARQTMQFFLTGEPDERPVKSTSIGFQRASEGNCTAHPTAAACVCTRGGGMFFVYEAWAWRQTDIGLAWNASGEATNWDGIGLGASHLPRKSSRLLGCPRLA